MNPYVAEALAYLKENWHAGVVGSSDAAYLLNINANTLKTRLARGQALVLRDPSGERRSTLTFTGYHLVYNLLFDRLLRYGLPVEQGERNLAELPHHYAQWAFDSVLSAPHYVDAILRFRREPDGEVQVMTYEEGGVEEWTGDAALIVPIGTMIVRLAATLHMRAASSNREHISRFLAARLAEDFRTK